MEDITRELINFWRKLGKLAGTGVPLLHTLDVIRQETIDPGLQDAIHQLCQDIKDGKSMSASIEKSPRYFPPSIHAMVMAGEIGGKLDTISLEIADGLEKGMFLGITPPRNCGRARARPGCLEPFSRSAVVRRRSVPFCNR